MKPYKVCDGCPCLNDDYEYGHECNMGYTSNYEYLITDTDPTPRYIQVSEDCKLIGIRCEDCEDEITPDIISGEIVERPETGGMFSMLNAISNNPPKCWDGYSRNSSIILNKLSSSKQIFKEQA